MRGEGGDQVRQTVTNYVIRDYLRGGRSRKYGGMPKPGRRPAAPADKTNRP